MPTRAASAATRTPAMSSLVVQDAALGRPQQPVRGGARASTCRSRSGRRSRPPRPGRSRGRRRRARACHPGRRSRRPRAERGHAGTALASRPAAATARARRTRAAGRPRDRRAAGPPGRPRPARRRRSDPRRARRPANRARRAGRSCARRRAAPSRSRPARAAPRRRGACPPGRAGPSVRRARGGGGRIASSEAMTTSWPWPPDSRRGSRSARSSMPRVASAHLVRATVSRARSPRFIGPSATSSKTDPVTPDSCVAGFWKPIPTRVAKSWSGLSAMGSPSIDRRRRSARRRSTPARGRMRRGRASTCRPRWRRRRRRSRRRPGSGRCRGGRSWHSRRSGSRPRRSVSIGRSDRRPMTRGTMSASEPDQQQPAQGPLPGRVRHRPQQVPPARVG